MAGNKHDNEEAVCKGTVLDHFVEKDEVFHMITALPTLNNDSIALERAAEHFIDILDRYQEQPHLLDPHLDEMIGELFQYVRGPTSPQWLIHHSFKYLYTLSKVRGAKMMVRHYSHEAADLQPALEMLSSQNTEDHRTWETRYVLLLWISFIIIIPFDLSRLDGSLQGQPPIVDQLLSIAKSYLKKPDKTQDAAGYLLARFVSRPDLKREKLPEFLDWCLKILATTDAQSLHGGTLMTGMLSSLSSLFKHGKREDLVQYAPAVLKELLQLALPEYNNILLRKLNIKLLQRLGMTFLPPRVASWRYQRGNRCLVTNLTAPVQNVNSNKVTMEPEREEGYDIPKETEDILGHLLHGLKDKDTVVRWSAAKGVGRICNRLPMELANEVIASLLDCLTFREGCGSWHGGCLALAELGRRGLLLPDLLQEVIPVVLKALAYDERHGAHSVGSNVRDAACYVCWAFARAYDPSVLLPYVTDVASALLATALFDRETNCRKAASAAFQENVGRQGTLPHGIVVMTTVDYFSVGNVTHSYLDLSVKIAQFPEYTDHLINHLLQYKLLHWDSVIRQLSSRSLLRLTSITPEYMKDKVLPVLLGRTFGSDLAEKHGALLGIAELATAWCSLPDKGIRITDHLTDVVIQQLIDIVPKLERFGALKGVGGDVMRPAVLHYIDRMSQCHLPVHDNTALLDTWQLVIEDNFSHAEDTIREGAASAFGAVCREYYNMTAPVQDLIGRFIAELESINRFSRRGFSLGLGRLPSFLLSNQLDEVLAALIKCATTIKDVEPKYTESRVDAIRAMISIVNKVGVCVTATPSLSSSDVTMIYEALLVAMSDYTSDSRGDIGALVREASMVALDELTRSLAATNSHLITSDLRILQLIVQQCCERIDRTRGVACNQLLSLVHYTNPVIPNIPHHKELLHIFNRPNIAIITVGVASLGHKESTANIDWTVAHSSFPVLVQLLSLNAYTHHALLGMIASVGGLTESTVKHSSSSLLGYLRTVSNRKETLDEFCSCLTTVFKDNQKNTRVTIPLFATLDLLLANSVFDLLLDCEDDPFLSTILELSKEEIRRSKDVKKILASINVFCGLLQFHMSIRNKALNQLMLFLGHTYPRVRKTTADQMYTVLLTYDELLPEDILDHVIAVLADTTWRNPLEEVRPVRNNLCELLGLPVPKQKGKATNPASVVGNDEFASYRDLVERAGF